ncbi:unnamed protein product [Somion occarium]|uniref:ABC transporter domain-containing protein n=1 Tax=Somion occarium TaxID=3059160 RepID=A0ABP1D3R5_9APHY
MMSLKPIHCYWQDLLLPFAEWSYRGLRDSSSKRILAHPGSSRSIYDVWLDSTTIPGDSMGRLLPGAHRSLTNKNLKLSLEIASKCILEFCGLIWSLHPYRLLAMISSNIFRGILPAFRGYSQAMIIDEIQCLFSSGDFTLTRLFHLLAFEIIRMGSESVLDTLATNNEQTLNNSIRFVMEHKQMEQRLRMDIPTMEDPVTRDLFQEADLFVRSFNGMSSFGLLSPFDVIRLLTLFSELVSHIVILYSLTLNDTPVLLSTISILSTLYPLLIPWLIPSRTYYDQNQNPRQSRLAEKQERMRSLAQSDSYRPEVIVFGLGPWILRNWAVARRATLGLGQPQSRSTTGPLSALLTPVDTTGLFTALQNVPLVLALQASSVSLGSFTLYRSSLQSLVYTSRNFYNTVHMAYQSIFLLGAFTASMQIKPSMQPKSEKVLPYVHSPRGMKIEARNICFTYPGSTVPALNNVSFSLEPGETLAVVGFNGSGKSTLANILLRVFEFGSGNLFVNGCDIRRVEPAEYHEHVAAVFQGFAKFHASARANIGVGYVADIHKTSAIERAAELADARHLLDSLPKGLNTNLEATQEARTPFGITSQHCQSSSRHGLSGGEWQRIAISRAFMRARRPEVELLLFDEPTSSLDAHAQNRVFDTIEELSTSPSGGRCKTVIFITHRLSTARRADKIAMMENVYH